MKSVFYLCWWHLVEVLFLQQLQLYIKPPLIYVAKKWHMELLNIGDQLMLLLLPLMLHKLLSITLLCTMDLKNPSTFLMAIESVVFGLFDIKLTMNICFFFICRGSCFECWHICLRLCTNREKHGFRFCIWVASLFFFLSHWPSHLRPLFFLWHQVVDLH